MICLKTILYLLTLTALIATFGACQSQPPKPAPQAATAQNSTDSSSSFLQRRLLELVQKEKELDELASKSNTQASQVQPMFQQLARDYRSLISDNPDKLEPRLLYGKLLSRYGDSEGAREQFLLAAKIDPEVAVIHQELGNYYAEEGDYTRALAYYLNAVHYGPDEAVFHFGLGQLLASYRYQFLQDQIFDQETLDQQMIEAFSQASSLQPDNLTFQFRLGEAFYDVDSPDWEQALLHWNQLQERDDLSPIQVDAVRLHRARCLLNLQRHGEARQIAQQVSTPALQQTKQALLDNISE